MTEGELVADGQITAQLLDRPPYIELRHEHPAIAQLLGCSGRRPHVVVVTGHEREAAKPVERQRCAELDDEPLTRRRRHRHRAGEGHVYRGEAPRDGRTDNHTDLGRHPLRNGFRNEQVRGQRQMRTVILDRSERDDDSVVAFEVLAHVDRRHVPERVGSRLV